MSRYLNYSKSNDARHGIDALYKPLTSLINPPPHHLLYHLPFQPALYPSGSKINESTNGHRQTTENLKIQEAAIILTQESATNWITSQTSDCNSQEERSTSNSNFPNRRDLGD